MRVSTRIPALWACLLLGSLCHAEQPTLETEDLKTFYSLGIALARDLATLDLTEAEFAAVSAGLADATFGRERQVPQETYYPQIQVVLQARMAAIAERERAAGAEFQKEATAEPGAEVLPSGVIYRELKPGTGDMPDTTANVRVHYTGMLRDGTVFDTSRKGDDPKPATFSLGQVVGCFRDGVAKMKVGGTSKMTCPPETSYGDRGNPPKIRGGATIVFEVELVQVVNAAVNSQSFP